MDVDEVRDLLLNRLALLIAVVSGLMLLDVLGLFA
jgi:hypothetical protein